MRKAIGLIAFALPLLVILLSDCTFQEMTSISISYWTDAGDIFVGSLVAVAFFLFAYNGTGDCRRDIEYWLSKAACVFAILVALFPTDNFKGGAGSVPAWVVSVSEYIHLEPNQIHNIAAILLFICLILLISFFSLRAKYKKAYSRSRFYKSISLAMLFGMPAVFLLGKVKGWYEPVFWVELVGLWLFAIGWFTAGSYKRIDEEPISSDATRLDVVRVDPREANFKTNVVIEAGVTYIFDAKGCWMDWFLECGPNGWGPDWNILTSRNRFKGKPIFMLCGNVGRHDDVDLIFSIGARGRWTAPSRINDLPMRERTLYLFANDWKSAYTNNKALSPNEGGPLKVTIYRL
jgi:hypothetical protein